MATTSKQRFHSRCGKNIDLSDNNTVARRVGSNWDSIVFTEQPVALGTVFQVKILEYDDSRYAGSIVSVQILGACLAGGRQLSTQHMHEFMILLGTVIFATRLNLVACSDAFSISLSFVR